MMTMTRFEKIPDSVIKSWGDFVNPGVWTPCYDPQKAWGSPPKFLSEIVMNERIPADDRIWAFTHHPSTSDKTRHILPVRFMRESPCGGGKYFVDIDKSGIAAAILDITERFLYDEMSEEDLVAATIGTWGLLARKTVGSAVMELAADVAFSAVNRTQWHHADIPWIIASRARRVAEASGYGQETKELASAAQIKILCSFFK